VEDDRTGDADTVFIDVTGPAWPQHPNDLRASVDALLAQGFGVAAADDGYLLLQRGIGQGGIEQRTFPDTFYTAWAAPQIDTSNSLGLRFGDSLELVDFRVAPDRYGELVAEMVWLPLAEITSDLRFHVAYVDADGSVLHDNQFYQPVNVLWYPTTLWKPGTPVRVRTLPWTLQSDLFVPLLGVYAGENWDEGEQLPITLADPASTSPLPLLQGGKIARMGGYVRDDSVQKRAQWQPIDNHAPPPAIPLDVDFGGMIHLLGADLPSQAQTGSSLSFTLHWQASAPVDFDYTTFAHLLDAQGNKVAQLDWQPHDRMGVLPTSAWPQGWPVIDTQQLPLPPDLPAGDYFLQIGVYNWQDGSRLQAQGPSMVGGVIVGGDAVQIGPVRIEPDP
jgi:hypothetical protein